jgi:CRP-like cAMP-binding protein
MASRMEKGLFLEPERLLGRYAREYAAGDLIFSMGEAGASIYYIYDGDIGVYLGPKGAETRVGVMKPGDFFGEMAHILDEPRTATVRAETDAVLFELTPAVYDQFLRSDSEALRSLADSLASRLKEADLRLAANRLGPPDGKAAKTKGDRAQGI